MTLRSRAFSETVTVTGRNAAHRDDARPRSATSSTSARIESLPLNGRQFANLAATVPGVGLGFHSDATKSAQYTPQISGGNGRNVNYLVDGGDNNDDTVGGLLQLFPLEAIQEFNVLTQRFKAEYGRSNGGVINVVTKSGTNNLRGSWFTLFRDDSAERADVQPSRSPTSTSRTTAATSSAAAFGGPIVAEQGALLRRRSSGRSRTRGRRSTRSASSRRRTASIDTPLPREPAHRQGHGDARPRRTTCSVRYGRNSNSQPSGAGAAQRADRWAHQHNKFNSVNVNHNWVIGGSGSTSSSSSTRTSRTTSRQQLRALR